MQTNSTPAHNQASQHDAKKSDPQPLLKLLAHQRLAFIVSKAQRLSYLQRSLQQALPAELQTSVQVMNVAGPNLIVAVASSHIASSIRFLTQDILNHLNQHHDPKHTLHTCQLSALRVKVRPNIALD